MAWAGVPSPMPGSTLEEEEQQRDAHDDLRSDQREEHQRVDAPAARPAPALQAERERDAERRRDRDADDRQEQRVLERPTAAPGRGTRCRPRR